MENIDIANGLIFREFEHEILRYKIYLLQELGIDMGYHYIWFSYNGGKNDKH